ncbi:magnesium/cobalt transporter CorA [Clostridium felsineum]|uniref:magnesium/cobalt transporter CorA n=1 Tax=Clostridium felsineum TaxID=36839 RepID=UPI00098C5CDB|nr:magnesium/cobalt transporter CorA [Clostridium felsineum]URZ16288.1 Cobalt/magnesium transport protein CorA [Clostridium felsineum DSM 794]
MNRYTKGVSRKRGLKPGTLVHIGTVTGKKTEIHIMDYKDDILKEKDTYNIEDCYKYKDTDNMTWINVNGLEDIALYQKLGEHFGIHSLIMEDILNTNQRPKIEEFEKYIFIVLKMIYFKDDKLVVEQISMICMQNLIITFQEASKAGDVFENLRTRIRNPKGKIRKTKVGYLTYALIDSIVDNYFVVLEKLEDKIEGFEESLMVNVSNNLFNEVYNLKRQMIYLWKAVWPLREIINTLQRGEVDIIEDKVSIYFKDVYDHTVQVIDTIELFRDMVAGLLDTYLSSASNKMNEIMKFLTIFSTIFIPLSFLVGVYGMNFDYMPELKFKYGYVILWMVMLSISGFMLMYFRKKKWL